METSDPGPTVKPVDLQQVADVIRHHLSEPVDRLVPLATYTDAVVVEAHLPERSVLFKAHRPRAAGERRVVLEAWTCEHVRAADVPAPPILAVDASCTRFPAAYFLMEHVPGRRLSLEEHTAEEARELLHDAGQLLRKVHSINVRGYGRLDDAHFLLTGEVRGEMPTWPDAVVGAVQQELAYLAGHELLAWDQLETIERLVAAYGGMVAGWGRDCLLNGDLGPESFFIHAGAITGVIDWGERAAGDPIWDLVTFDWAPSQELRWLLEGYETHVPVEEITEVRLPLYAVLQAVPWAAWCHRRGYVRPLRVLEHVARRACAMLTV